MDFLYISDDSCHITKAPTRVHHLSMAEGRLLPVTFNVGKLTKIPFEIGVKLAGKDGFNLFVDEVGEKPFDSTPAAKQSDVTLNSSQVVAFLSELTKESLQIRVHQIPGGELMKTASKDSLIDFLIEKANDEKSLIQPDHVEPDDMDSHGVTSLLNG